MGTSFAFVPHFLIFNETRLIGIFCFPYLSASSGFELKDLFPPSPPPHPPTSLASKLDVTVETDNVMFGTKDVIS